MQTASGGPIRWARKKEDLGGIFNSLSKPSIQQRRQEQANRLNRSNSIGNYAYQAGKAFGFKMSEDSVNLATINSASKEALKDTRDYYNSQEYEQRLKDAGVPLSNRNSLLDKLQNVPIYSLSNKSIPEFKTNGGGNFRAATATKPFKGNVTGKRFGPGVYYNKSTMKDGNGENVYGTFIHEFSHWADPGLFPEAIEYNRSLTEGNLNSKASPYFRSDTEIRARAMDGIVTYEKNKDKYRDLDDFLDKEKDVKGLRELRNTFKDEKSFRNYMHHFVLNNTPKFDSNNVYYAKFGNKLLKNGSGIHIKKKNRGSFTRWCGGNVTEECIRRGKASSNPKIRKKATFADNARHFKHKDGGVLYIFQEGGKTSWWNKTINFVNNSGLGEVALNALSTYTQNKQIGASSDVAKAQVDKNKASRIQQANLAAEQEARDIQQNNINPENPNAMSGDIVKNFIKNKLLSQKMALINQESNQEKAEIDWQTQQLKNQNTGIGSALMQGLGHVGQYLGNKQQTNVNNT